MFRDFSEEAKQNLKTLVSQVESENISKFTDWIGDRWYDFEELIGKLNIRNYLDRVNEYHKVVIDKNNTTLKDIDRIFNQVNGVNNAYGTIFKNTSELLITWQKYIDTLNGFVKPEGEKFDADAINISMHSITAEIDNMNVQCLKDRMVQNINGQLVFDEDLIYEYVKKDMSELSSEERQAVVDVISQMKDTVVVYETLATYGTDEAGVDLGQHAAWINDNTEFESYTDVSIHYNEKYINLLNYISEHSNEENTVASSLVKICDGDKSVELLGKEYYDSVGKIFGTTSFTEYLIKYKSEHTEQYFMKLERIENSSLKASAEFKEKINDPVEDGLKNKKLYKDEEETVYLDSSGNKIKKEDAPKFFKKEATLVENKINKVVSESIYDGTFDTPGDGNVNVVIGNAEAHGSFSSGLYTVQYKDNGEEIRKFSPAVNAEVGASVTALEVDWQQQWLGDEMLGLNTDVDVTVGKVGATADLGIQMYGEDGNLAIQAGAGVKVEAIAAEAGGSIGLNALGGEVGVKGSVNVGIGAHADVGYKDGVFKLDIGASIGVGASVGLEIDVGGMVDSACDVAESAWNGLKDGFNKLKWW